MAFDGPIAARKCAWRGVDFRSSLELRWAVYFDSLGLKWEYEPFFFRSSDGRNYLPDFRIAELGVLVEVKPHSQSGADADRYAMAAKTAVAEYLCRVFVFVVGPPRPGVHHAAYWKHGERTYSFASVTGESVDAVACRRAQDYRAEDEEAERAQRKRAMVAEGEEAGRLSVADTRLHRLLDMTPEEIAADYERRS